MNILIDTNIIINLEDNKILEESFTKFIQLASGNNCIIYYHKDCIKDVLRDNNSERKNITLSKLKKYNSFPKPIIPSEEFIIEVGQKNINDEIDNKQLYQAYMGYADLFVTIDNGIIKKANKLVLKNVLHIKEAVELLTDKFTLRIPTHPLLEHVSLRDITDTLNNIFFNSLREDYNGFDKWFKDSAQKNRQCYFFKSGENIEAILIYKTETATDHRIANEYDAALKMCTFKVAETSFGNKLGELFLSKMFSLCIEKQIPNLYLTVFEKHFHLIKLLESYGFRKFSFKNKDGKDELIYLKKMNKKTIENINNLKTDHPFYYDNEQIEKFVIPIQDKFYRTLFKDGTLRQSQLFDKDEASINEIQGNTITKAYICGSPRKTMKEGSILLFYASKNKQVIEPVGILESLNRISDYTELKLFVSKRTVFTEEELKMMLESKKELTVVLFRLVYYINTPVSFKTIKELESFSNKFTSITTLKEKDYQLLKSKNYFDERYIIN